MGWFLWMSYPIKHLITWHVPIFETRVGECSSYSPLHPQIFWLHAVSPGAWPARITFFLFFFFASLAPSTNGRHEQENKKWEKKDVGAFFLPHSLPCVAILAVTMALPLQTLLEASLCKALALTGF